MRQRKQTFDTLMLRNQRLTTKYEAMRNRLAIPHWGPSAAHSSGNAPMTSAAIHVPTHETMTNKIPQGPQPQACVVNPAALANPAAAPVNPPQPMGIFPHRDIQLTPPVNPGVDKGAGRPGQAMATRGPGVIQQAGKRQAMFRDKGIKGGKGDFKANKGDKGNRVRYNPNLPIESEPAGNDRWPNTNIVRMMEVKLINNAAATMHAVAQYIAGLIPATRVTNEAMADSQVNCSVVITGLPWHSPECDSLRDILTFGGILDEGRYGVHYAQLNRRWDGKATGTAFIGFVKRKLAIACGHMYHGYKGGSGTLVTVMENESGNPLHHCDPRRRGNPRCDSDIWNYPEPLDNERREFRGHSFGSPTFEFTWQAIIQAGLVRV